MKQKYSVVIPGEINSRFLQHLIREDGQEDLCFALYNPGSGLERFTGIIDEIILPEEADRQIHGNVSFNPCYYERALLLAKQKNKGVAFLHSHPGPGYQGMSNDDIKAETQMAGAVKSVTGLPLLGLTTGNDGTWCARFWFRNNNRKKKYKKQWCESVRVFGNQLKFYFNDTLLRPSVNEEALMRTISAWGKKTQENISRIKIAIVGLGSVGSIVAECLSRTGFAYFTLIDFDRYEEKNRDRCMNVKKKHIGKRKVDVVAQAIKENGTAQKININKFPDSIYDEKAFKAALDCDVIFSCVDRPHPRQILNFIAYTYMIPVIDGGILVRTNKINTKLIGADWKVQTVGYDRPCLECLDQFTAPMAAADKEGLLDDPKYMEGADESLHRMKANENVFAFSLNVASLEVLQLISLLVLPEYLAKVKQQFYHFTLRDFEKEVPGECKDKCFYKAITAAGDNAGVIMYRYSAPALSA
jgi:molybdopterin/thiamine biosynthesis adenylyltransferase